MGTNISKGTYIRPYMHGAFEATDISFIPPRHAMSSGRKLSHTRATPVFTARDLVRLYTARTRAPRLRAPSTPWEVRPDFTTRRTDNLGAHETRVRLYGGERG